MSGAFSKAAGDGFSGALSRVASGNISEAFSDAISQYQIRTRRWFSWARRFPKVTARAEVGLELLRGANLDESLMPMFSRAMESTENPSAFFSGDSIQAFAAKAENSEQLAELTKYVSQYWDGSAESFKKVQEYTDRHICGARACALRELMACAAARDVVRSGHDSQCAGGVELALVGPGPDGILPTTKSEEDAHGDPGRASTGHRRGA